jgi:hypothetical protein
MSTTVVGDGGALSSKPMLADMAASTLTGGGSGPRRSRALAAAVSAAASVCFWDAVIGGVDVAVVGAVLVAVAAVAAVAAIGGVVAAVASSAAAAVTAVAVGGGAAAGVAARGGADAVGDGIVEVCGVIDTACIMPVVVGRGRDAACVSGVDRAAVGVGGEVNGGVDEPAAAFMAAGPGATLVGACCTPMAARLGMGNVPVWEGRKARISSARFLLPARS